MKNNLGGAQFRTYIEIVGDQKIRFGKLTLVDNPKPFKNYDNIFTFELILDDTEPLDIKECFDVKKGIVEAVAYCPKLGATHIVHIQKDNLKVVNGAIIYRAMCTENPLDTNLVKVAGTESNSITKAHFLHHPKTPMKRIYTAYYMTYFKRHFNKYDDFEDWLVKLPGFIDAYHNYCINYEYYRNVMLPILVNKNPDVHIKDSFPADLIVTTTTDKESVQLNKSGDVVTTNGIKYVDKIMAPLHCICEKCDLPISHSDDGSGIFDACIAFEMTKKSYELMSDIIVSIKSIGGCHVETKMQVGEDDIKLIIIYFRKLNPYVETNDLIRQMVKIISENIPATPKIWGEVKDVLTDNKNILGEDVFNMYNKIWFNGEE